MKPFFFLLALLICVTVTAQTDFAAYNFLKYNPDAACNTGVKGTRPFGSYAAVFFDGKRVKGDYNGKEEIIITSASRGTFTVATVKLAGDTVTPAEPVPFRVAVKAKWAHTLYMFSTEVMYEADLEELLKECRPGDSILFLTADKNYSIPYYEIEIADGC